MKLMKISKLGNLLNQIRHKEVKIRSVAVSLQLMIKQPNYEFYQNRMVYLESTSLVTV